MSESIAKKKAHFVSVKLHWNRTPKEWIAEVIQDESSCMQVVSGRPLSAPLPTSGCRWNMLNVQLRVSPARGSKQRDELVVLFRVAWQLFHGCCFTGVWDHIWRQENENIMRPLWTHWYYQRVCKWRWPAFVCCILWIFPRNSKKKKKKMEVKSSD